MDKPPQCDSFEELSKHAQSPNLMSEFWEFMRHNKKWWMLPILIVLLIFGILIFVSGTGAAPFIYVLY